MKILLEGREITKLPLMLSNIHIMDKEGKLSHFVKVEPDLRTVSLYGNNNEQIMLYDIPSDEFNFVMEQCYMEESFSWVLCMSISLPQYICVED